MKIQKIHKALQDLKKDTPIIAFLRPMWETQLAKFSKDYFGGLKLKDVETPLDGIVADIKVLQNGVTNYKKYDSIAHEEYILEFELKVKKDDGNKQQQRYARPSGYISRHQIRFESIEFEVSTTGGNVFLQKVSEKYFSKPPDIGSTIREDHFDVLRTYYNYTNGKIDYFIRYQEPASGLLVANGILERFNNPFKIVDFDIMFPRIRFSGDFEFLDLKIDNDDLICFLPSEFNLLPPSKCDEQIQRNRTYGSGSYKNGEFNIGGGAFPSVSVGSKPNPSGSKKSEIFFYLPQGAGELLFKLSKPSEQNFASAPITFAKSSDKWEIPPFLIDHSAKIRASEQVKITWNKTQPIVGLEVKFLFDFKLKVWLKVFRLKTKIAGINTSNQYKLDYEGKILELYTGDLGLVGELYDPTNVTIKNLNLDTILPDSIDRVASRILKFVLEPILRYFITKLMISVTWPLISKYILFGLAGEESSSITNSGRTPGKGPQEIPKIELANYYSEANNVTIGVNARVKEFG